MKEMTMEEAVAMQKGLKDGVCIMPLCEPDHVVLRPNQLYMFVVMPGCKSCERKLKEGEQK